MRISFAGGGSDLPPFVPGIPGRVVGSAIDLRVRAIIEGLVGTYLRASAYGEDDEANGHALLVC